MKSSWKSGEQQKLKKNNRFCTKIWSTVSSADDNIIPNCQTIIVLTATAHCITSYVRSLNIIRILCVIEIIFCLFHLRPSIMTAHAKSVRNTKFVCQCLCMEYMKIDPLRKLMWLRRIVVVLVGTIEQNKWELVHSIWSVCGCVCIFIASNKIQQNFKKQSFCQTTCLFRSYIVSLSVQKSINISLQLFEQSSVMYDKNPYRSKIILFWE